MPALFILGKSVRDCHWQAQGQGSSRARDVIDQSLHVIMHLHWGHEEVVEYVRTTLAASMLWSVWHSRTPPGIHSEEPCETILGRLGNQMCQHKNITSLEECSDLFLLLDPADPTPKDIKYGNIKAGLPQLIRDRFWALVRDPSAVSFVPWARKKQSICERNWPANFQHPSHLTEPVSSAHLADLARKTIRTLVSPVGNAAEALARLQQQVPRRPPTNLANHIRELKMISDK